MCLSTKLASLHHVDENWLELESMVSNIDIRSSTNVGSGWSRESWRVLSAMASNSGIKLRLILLSSDSEARTFLSLALVLLINTLGSST